MVELTRNSDLIEVGIDEFAPSVKEVPKKAGRPKKVEEPEEVEE